MGPTPQTCFYHPLIVLAAGLSVGIVLAHFIAIPPLVSVASSGLIVCLSLWQLRSRGRLAATVFVIGGSITTGAALETIHRQNAKSNQLKSVLEQGFIAMGEPVELVGAMDGPPEPAPGGFYLIVRVQGAHYKRSDLSVSGVVMLWAPVHDARMESDYDQLDLRHGAHLRVMTTLDRADTFRNPGVSSFTEYLERKGYDATGTIKSPLLIQRLDDERVFLPLAFLYQWRHSLLARINHMFSAETAGVLDAALLGNRYFLSHGVAERFRSGGTFHVLVISGLHISFIGGAVFLLMRRITRSAALQFVVSVSVLWAYAIAVGAEASVVRAALMFTLVVLAPLLARRAKSLNVLGGTALALLSWQPNTLFDPSFQLTFLSVFMIITLGWPLWQRMQAAGAWQPTARTPAPPSCPQWFRTVSEVLFWSQKKWRREMAEANFSYKLFKSPLAVRLERYQLQRLLRFATGAIVVSASVQLGLLPLLVLYFHRFTIASLVLNIGVGALMAALGIVALVALAVGEVSTTLALPLVKLAQSLNWLMVHSGDLLSGWRVTSLRLPEYAGPAAAIYALYFVPLLGLLFAVARWNPLRLPASTKTTRRARVNWLMAAALALLLLLIVFHPFSAGRASGHLRVDFLDVGQGDAALLTMPDGSTLLIDGGGQPTFNRAAAAQEEEESFTRDTRTIGEAVVSEYLWGRGLDRVDYVLATHADADHIEGLNDVLRNFQVRAAFVARAPAGDPEYRQFADTARTAGVPVQIISAGDVLVFGDVRLETLWPAATPDINSPSGNNQSLVLRVRYGESRILLTGDIEQAGEAGLLNQRLDLRSDIVKVAHHGSRTSSTEAFVNATHPSLAVISVGRTSIFGHPHPEVVERWRHGGAQVLTTGECGMITIATDGRNLRLSRFVGP
ncbi:MAG: competence protein ComEC [Blastocatellia bacterium]|jgi:competence protein ComEC|nr:competence protein ComEC [Blastocatellia bacterium]